MRNIVDVFVHIPKTGGSSLRTLLNSNYRKTEAFYFEPHNRALASSNVSDLIDAVRSAEVPRLIQGHYPLGVHHLINSPCRYVSFIRDPVARVVSDFLYAYSYDGHPYAEGIRSGLLSFYDYALSESYFSGADQCRMIAGIYSERDYALEQAIWSVENQYVYCGAVEDFDWDIVCMAHLMGWREMSYDYRNKTPGIDSVSTIVKEQVETFRQDLHWKFQPDRLFHNWVRKRNQAIRNSLDPQLLKILDSSVSKNRHSNSKNELDRYSHYIFSGVNSFEMPEFDNQRQEINKSFNIHSLKNYVGFVDSVEGCMIRGWAADLYTNTPLVVCLYDGDRLVGIAETESERQDVYAVSASPTPTCGFEFTVKKPLTLPSVRIKNCPLRLPSSSSDLS